MLLLKELTVILGVGPFEIAAHSLGLFVFTILLTLRVESVLTSSWHVLFIPLYTALIIDAYYTVIQLTRLILHSFKDERERVFVFFSFTLSILSAARLAILAYMEIQIGNVLDNRTSVDALILPVTFVFVYVSLRTMFVFKTIENH